MPAMSEKRRDAVSLMTDGDVIVKALHYDDGAEIHSPQN
jgi:hypothetical protein